MPTIKVEIDKFGQPKILAEGFTGAACQHATASLEKALRAGADRVKTERRPKSNMHTARAVNIVGGK